MELQILGYNSALPTVNSHPTSQILNINQRLYLIDCGEGTQVQMRKAKIKFSKINHIFISHLHGDHLFGLIGLISTFNLVGRNKPLHIFGPKGIKQFIEIQLTLTHSKGMYPIIYKELNITQSELIFEDEKVSVYNIPLHHRIYCNGYLFKEKPKARKLNKKAIDQYPEIEVCDYKNLTLGKDYQLEDGTILPNETLTFENVKPISYAFLSDTMEIPNPPEILYTTDVVYHESTFLESHKNIAQLTGHSTALEAGNLASKIKAKALILGHFSNRYTNYNAFKEEAEQQFPNVIIPEPLKIYPLRTLIEKEKILK